MFATLRRSLVWLPNSPKGLQACLFFIPFRAFHPLRLPCLIVPFRICFTKRAWIFKTFQILRSLNDLYFFVIISSSSNQILLFSRPPDRLCPEPRAGILRPIRPVPYAFAVLLYAPIYALHLRNYSAVKTLWYGCETRPRLPLSDGVVNNLQYFLK